MRAKNPKRIRSEEPGVLKAEHEEAHLAYLIELIMRDEDFEAGHKLKSLANHPALVREDVVELAGAVIELAGTLQFSPRILAYALIQWFAESDLSPSTVQGSANWSFEAPHIGFNRKDLLVKFRSLYGLILMTLRTGRLDPEECLNECIRLNEELGDVLAQGKRNLGELKGKRKQLFYSMSKVRMKAFYLSAIRGLNLDSSRVQELLSEANAPFDLRQTNDRIAAQRQIYEWCRSVRELFALVEADLPSN